jgi:hypothetical protein
MFSNSDLAKWNSLLCSLTVCALIWYVPEEAVSVMAPRVRLGSPRLEMFMYHLFLAYSLTLQANTRGLEIARMVAGFVGGLNILRLLFLLRTLNPLGEHAAEWLFGLYVWGCSLLLFCFWKISADAQPR